MSCSSCHKLLKLLLLFELTQISATERFYLPGAAGSGPFETVKDWIAAFQAKFPEVELSVSSVGSGAAQSALWGQVDCVKKPVQGLCDNGTDTSTTSIWGIGGGGIDSETFEIHEDRELQQLPAVGGPILLTYSKDVTGDLGSQTSKQLNMSADVVAGIFNNTILYWNDPALVAQNPNLDLPSERITVVVRSDKSGMSQTLTEFIQHTNPATWPQEAVGKSPEWPLQNLTFSSESSGVMCLADDTIDNDASRNFKGSGQTGIGISLLRRPFSIGYLELGYFSMLTQFVAQAHVAGITHPGTTHPRQFRVSKPQWEVSQMLSRRICF